MEMTYVEAPNELPQGPRPAIFCAGGITGCPQWQADAAYLVRASGWGGILLNPRRADYRPAPGAHAAQVAWERAALLRADLVMVWLPAADGAVQPIALWELGAAAERRVPLVVGAEDGYVRRRDVVEQLRWARPEVSVRRTLAETVTAAVAAAPARRREPVQVEPLMDLDAPPGGGAYRVTVALDAAPAPLAGVLPVGAVIRYQGLRLRVLGAEVDAETVIYRADPA